MNKRNCIVIAAGGTGGHVFPSIGLANYLIKDYDIEIFTDERGIKYLNNLVSRNEIPDPKLFDIRKICSEVNLN